MPRFDLVGDGQSLQVCSPVVVLCFVERKKTHCSPVVVRKKTYFCVAQFASHSFFVSNVPMKVLRTRRACVFLFGLIYWGRFAYSMHGMSEGIDVGGLLIQCTGCGRFAYSMHGFCFRFCTFAQYFLLQFADSFNLVGGGIWLIILIVGVTTDDLCKFVPLL